MSALSYAHGVATEPLLGQTIGANLRDSVAVDPDRPALVVCHQAARFTYGQLWESVTRVARGLLALGVKPGDRVGIWSPNRWEWVAAQFGTARIGAILVCVNPGYRPNELAFALRQSGVSVLLRSPGFRQLKYDVVLAEARGQCPNLRHDVVFGTPGWEDFLESGRTIEPGEVDRIEAGLQFDEPINIQYTSGTTGLPKGATLSHHNVLNNARFIGRALGYTPADRVCVPVPFYHCFGMVLGTLACTTHGACMVVPGESFAARSVLEAVDAERCTSLYGVPTMFRAIVEEPGFAEFDSTSLRTGIMSGAPCPIELMRRVLTELHMPEVVIAYGMTETSPVSTMSSRDDPIERRVTTVGRPLPHVEASIRDPATGAVVPRGTPGEYCARGYLVMRGYWDNEPATRAAIDAAGWMHSGDLAVMDESGDLHIVGRLKDMIIRGGENIYPKEIEAVLHTHPGVSEVYVVGVPSRKYGEEVMAWVRPSPEAVPTFEDLTEYCKARLATVKVPKFWRFTESFPMTVTGKVQKFRLRELAIEALGLQGEIEAMA